MNNPLAPDIKKLFEGRRLLIATQHGKEKILGPALEQSLAVQAFVLPGYNTDQFGTFSGEVERPADAVATLRKKILLAMQLTGADLAVGSEGSFGPHPQVGWVAANQEWLMLIDLRHDLEITSQTVSTDTNFAQQPVSTWPALDAFARQAGFPAAALILRAETPAGPQFEKAIQDETHLRAAFDSLQMQGPVSAETDMRAHYNPLRQRVIAEACSKLIARICNPCPQCGSPGFSMTTVVRGLPCGWCGEPTGLVASEIFACPKCKFTREVPVSGNANPQFCPHCNP